MGVRVAARTPIDLAWNSCKLAHAQEMKQKYAARDMLDPTKGLWWPGFQTTFGVSSKSVLSFRANVKCNSSVLFLELPRYGPRNLEI